MTETRLYTKWVIEDLKTGDPVDVRGAMSEEMSRAFVKPRTSRYRLMRVDVVEVWQEIRT